MSGTQASAAVVDWWMPWGVWQHGFNWTTGTMPAAGDTARFATGSLTSIGTEAPVTIAETLVSADTHVQVVSTIPFNLGRLVVGDTTSGEMTTLYSATVLQARMAAGPLSVDNAVMLGRSAGATGRLTVNEGRFEIVPLGTALPGATGSDARFNIGHQGVGHFNVKNGGTAITGTTRIAGSATATGSTALIEDAGSKWSVTGALTVGLVGSAQLTVREGAALQATGLFIGMDQADEAGSSVTFTGAGTKGTLGQIMVGASGFDSGSVGVLSIEDGAQVTASVAGGFDHNFGTNIGDRGVLNLSGSSSYLSITDGNLIIGRSGAGTVLMHSGADLLVADDLVLGRDAGGTGALVALNNETYLQIAGQIRVGEAGAGSLQFSDQAYFQAGTIAVNKGHLQLTGAGGKTDSLHLGVDGTATIIAGGYVDTPEITVDGGELTFDSYVTAAYGYSTGAWTFTGGASLQHAGLVVGHAESDVTVTASGAGTTITGTGPINLGHQGTGTLALSSGAALSGTLGYVGDQATGEGTFSLSGAGTNATLAQLFVGHFGTGTLELRAGAELTVAATSGSPSAPVENLFIGTKAGSTGVVTVAGEGTQLTVTQGINVGAAGTGSLTISDGGAVEMTTQRLLLGDQASGSGTVVVTGAGSVLQMGSEAYPLRVGWRGTGSLTVADGASLGSNVVETGFAASGHGEILITGAETTAWMANYLHLGDNGSGSLTVRDGARLNLEAGYVWDGHILAAVNPGSTGSLLFEGEGTEVFTNGSLHLGRNGTFEGTIRDQAHVESAKGLQLGIEAAGEGHLTVTGMGTEVEFAGASSASQIGQAGSGALDVEDGGFVFFGHSVSIGNLAGSDGVLRVTGGAVEIDRDDNVFTQLVVGERGEGALAVTAGGVVEVQNRVSVGGTVAGAAGEGTLTVAGVGSRVEVKSGGILIGHRATGTATVSDGATIGATVQVTVGSSAGSTGSLTVTGPGSTVWTDGFLNAGASGQGTITASAGAQLVAKDVDIGWQPGSSGILTVTGAGTKLTVANELGMGESGSAAARLLVGDGAQVEAGFLSLHHGEASFTGGATLVTDTRIAIGALPGNDARLVVSGAGTHLDVGNYLDAGYRSHGELVLSDGASIHVGEAMGVTWQAGSTGAATVTGSGTALTVVGDLWVGIASSDAAFTASDGAEVTALRFGAVQGLTTIASGATLSAGQFAYTLPGGTLHLADGTVMAPQFFNSGALTGNGVLDTTLLWNNGLLDLGTSPGAITLTGDLVQTAASLLRFDLATGLAGVARDDLAVGGDLTLGGTLALSTPATATYAAGDVLGAIRLTGSSATVQGGFHRITGLELANDLTVELEVGADAVSFVARPTATPAEVLAGTRSGSVTLAAGTVVSTPLALGSTVGRTGEITILGDVTFSDLASVGVLGGGTLTLAPGATLVAEQGLTIGEFGQLDGTGTLVTPQVINGGLFAMGFSPGAVVIEGGYEQLATGTLQFEIGGAAPGTGYDTLVVDGDVTLGGLLEIVRYGGYVAPGGTTFTVLEWTGALSLGASFAFSGLSDPDLGSTFFTAQWLDHSLVLTAVPEPATWAALAGLAALALAFAGRRRAHRRH